MTVPRCAGVLAGLFCALAFALPAVAGADVVVRVEGESATLVAPTAVRQEALEPAPGCAERRSALAALNAAVRGDYETGANGVITRIRSETHAFGPRSDYWAFWVGRGGRYVRADAPCAELLADGDELLVFPDFSPPPAFAPSVYPLAVEGLPASAQAGQALTVTVVEYRSPDFGPSVRTPVAGATVTAGGVSAVSGEDGRATLTPAAAGPVIVRATRPGSAPSYPSTLAVGAVPGAAPTPPCPTSGDDGRCGTPDRRAAQARLTGLREGATYRRARAPRRLQGTVAADPSGIRQVKLSITRRHRGDCEAFSRTRERFRGATCGRRAFFGIGTDASWSFLLPERPAPGRYVVDVVAIDNAGNRDTLERGRNRVVFTVR